MNDTSRTLSVIEPGEPWSAQRLLPLVYDELRALAARRIAREKPGQTLQATALVHESYLRLVGSGDPGWDGRAHFFAAAAEAMRRILVDRARHKAAAKAGAGRGRTPLEDAVITIEGPNFDMIALDEALRKLEAIDRRKADLVKLRFFVGLTADQAAEVLGISPSTADNDWAYARSWLRVAMNGDRTA